MRPLISTPSACEPALFEILSAHPVPLAPSVPPSTLFSCAICTIVAASVARGLKSFLSEFVNDPKSREQFRAARGFCGDHVQLLQASGDALGIAILYADLADQTLQRWKCASVGKRPGFVGRTASRQASCPACSLETEANSRYSCALAAGLSDEQVWASLEDGLSLCTTHVERIAENAKLPLAKRLYELEAAKLEALQSELNEVIRKNDYRFRGEEWGAERDAWIRALAQIMRPG